MGSDVQGGHAPLVHAQGHARRALVGRFQHRESGARYKAGARKTNALSLFQLILLLIPANFLCSRIQCLLVCAAGDCQSGRSHVSGVCRAYLAELNRVNAHLVSRELHVQVMGKMHLACRISSHGSCRRVIGIHTPCQEIHGIHLVREVGPQCGLGAGRNTGPAVRSSVQHMVAFLCQQLTVCPKGSVNMHVNGVAVARGLEYFFAGQNHAYRASGHLRHLGSAKTKGIGIQLAAETAAHKRLDYPHLVLSNAKAAGIPELVHKGHLGGHPDGVGPIPVGSHCAVGLHGRMYHTVGLVIPVLHIGCAVKFLINIRARLHHGLHADIVYAFALPVYLGGILLHRLKGVKHPRKHLVLYLNQIRGPLGGFLIHSCHGCHIVTNLAHLLRTQYFLVRELSCKFSISHQGLPLKVPGSEDALYTWKLLCLAGVNGQDFCRCIRASDHFSGKHIREHDVPHILAVSCYLVFSVNPDIIVLAGQTVKFRFFKIMFVTVFMHSLLPPPSSSAQRLPGLPPQSLHNRCSGTDCPQWLPGFPVP